MNCMKTLKFIILMVCCSTFFACSEDDAELCSAYVDMNTTDYLRKNQFQIFTMSLELFEKAGYLDLLDKEGVTVFMPTNYSIKHYLAQKTALLQEETGDENLEYTFDDLIADLPQVGDSLKMYIVDQEINRSDLEQMSGESVTVECMLGCEMNIRLKQSKLYTEWVPNSVNKYLYYTFIINGLDPDTGTVPVEDKDVTNYCQTSGLITKTGILHVLRDEHPLFFNRYEYK